MSGAGYDASTCLHGHPIVTVREERETSGPDVQYREKPYVLADGRCEHPGCPVVLLQFRGTLAQLRAENHRQIVATQENT